jgi:hypothetical protein
VCGSWYSLRKLQKAMLSEVSVRVLGSVVSGY